MYGWITAASPKVLVSGTMESSRSVQATSLTFRFNVEPNDQLKALPSDLSVIVYQIGAHACVSLR